MNQPESPVGPCAVPDQRDPVFTGQVEPPRAADHGVGEARPQQAEADGPLGVGTVSVPLAQAAVPPPFPAPGQQSFDSLEYLHEK